MADLRIFIPKWTNEIHEEWTRNLLLKRPELSRDQLLTTIDCMNGAFPAANISHYPHLPDYLDLPDQGDRHVIEAAVHCKADLIKTSNLKDFPDKVLKIFGLQALYPDLFIVNFILGNPDQVLKAFGHQVHNLRKPPMTSGQVVENLKKYRTRKDSRPFKKLVIISLPDIVTQSTPEPL